MNSNNSIKSAAFFSLITIFTSLSAASATAAASTPEKTSNAAKVSWLPSEGQLENLRTAFDVPGFSIISIDKCEPVGVPINLGLATMEPDSSVVDNTVFEAASLSKPVFAYLVMQLVQEGTIELDRTIAEEFSYPRITDRENYSLITPRMVLSHQSGLPNWVGDTDNAGRTDLIEFQAIPGSDYTYSGEAYELLRRYVEFKTETSLNELFRERLGTLMPLSSFASTAPKGTKSSRGYASSSRDNVGRALSNLGGAAGGLVTTASDYAMFVSAVCKSHGLSNGIRDAMLEPQVTANPGEFPAPTSWALGWGLMSLGSEIIVFHGGNNTEYRSFAGYSKSKGEGLVIFINGRNGGDMIDAILEQSQ